MIRGIDFFKYSMEEIQKDPAFDIVHESVTEVGTENGEAFCRTSVSEYRSPYLFNSILFDKPRLAAGEYFLLQHFKGWVIRSEKPVFSVDQPILMDFRPSQHRGTTFVYLMPFSAHEALVEYTLFTRDLLSDQEYVAGLDGYIRNQLGLDEWAILEEEFGIIPMTNHRFQRRNGAVLNIGTAGGRTKASSGYTFRFIQKDTEDIINSLRETGAPFRIPADQSRFLWYDSVLLNILNGNRLQGHEVFTYLFQNNSSERIFKFLDNETSVREELSILASLPQLPFMKAGIEEGFKWMRR
jgi:lycopene beta-cyclase